MKHRGTTASPRPASELQWFVRFKPCEQIRKGHFERLGDADKRCEAKILPSRFEVPDKRAVHFEVVRQRLLRSKAALHADIPYPLPEALKYVFHAPSVKDGLPDALPLDR